MKEQECVLVLDFGAQYSQLIARRVREASVYCEILPWNAPVEVILQKKPKGIILSGGPASVYRKGAPRLDRRILELGVPVLGICYGLQLGALLLGGKVVRTPGREYGRATCELLDKKDLFAGLPDRLSVWMSHGDHVSRIGRSFDVLARTENAPFAALRARHLPFYGVQFHPEVVHTQLGGKIIRNFLYRVCGCRGTWKMRSYLAQCIVDIRREVGNKKVICALSGGVDSSVVALLLHEAIGDNLVCVFVDNSFLRLNEAEQVVKTYRDHYRINLKFVDASKRFLRGLRGVKDPEKKRKIIGREFISVFTDAVKRLTGSPAKTAGARGTTGEGEAPAEPRRREGGTDFPPFEKGGAGGDLSGESHRDEKNPPSPPFAKGGNRKSKAPGIEYLAQGTLYPDVIESRSVWGGPTSVIKTHHNVGGLPAKLKFKLIEPLKYLFKDEVRVMAKELGMPASIYKRQPFPGPGLAVRIVGEVTARRLDLLRRADAIVTEEVEKAGLNADLWQYFAVLLPISSVGVMGDERTYEYCVALRVVESVDGMTADWARLPYDILHRISSRITSEVRGINRVVLDVSSKPPATIEWE